MADVMDVNKECCRCLQISSDPRVLPCLHTVCLKCLENMGATIPNDWLLCSVCRSKFGVPEEELKGLPKEKEHLIVDLSCRKETKTVEEKEAHRCRAHQGETPKLFCTFCKKVICDKCFQESHSSHSCTDITDVLNLVCKQAEKEYNDVENMQHKFQDKRETLHREQMKFLEEMKKMESEILQRCENIKELVVRETKALLQELAALKTERLQEIEIEQGRIDKHVFTLEKFKEYCIFIKSNCALNYLYTCEAECILLNNAKELKLRDMIRIENRIFPLAFELQKTEIQELRMPISNAIGKINVNCSYNMERRIAINLGERTVHGMASLEDKLYLLSDSVFIRCAENPHDCFGKIDIPEIKSPASIVSCCKTSRLYIYDKGNACIWKVSVPDNRVTRWCNKVKEPCAMSVTHNGEVLMTAQSEDTNHPVTVEIYNQNAILTESVDLPKDIRSLQYIYKIPSGNYIGLGEQHLYKFRADGSTVCKRDIPKHQESGNCVRRLEVSPYHIFLISTSVSLSCKDSKVSQISFDLAVESDVLKGSNEQRSIVGLCYVKSTKALAVLELEQLLGYRPKYAPQKRNGLLTIYAVL